jgi:L-amino acid N-acyltransferase YncA
MRECRTSGSVRGVPSNGHPYRNRRGHPTSGHVCLRRFLRSGWRGKLEIEIQTHRQFRRRGLARAVAAALILYCIEHGIEACWDAANEPSAALARQLGFHSTGKYEAYRLK